MKLQSKIVDGEPFWIIGCIGHDGAIVGRAYPDNSKPGGGCNTHTESESRGKRWRWHIQDAGFMETLDGLRSGLGLDELTGEERLRVIDWLVKEGWAGQKDYCKYRRILEVRGDLD